MLDLLKEQYEGSKDKYNQGQYNGYVFKINGKTVFYREGKVTPKYNGVFVTLWKKEGDVNGSYKDGYTNIPYEASEIDYIIVKVDSEKYFLLTKEILLDLGILKNEKNKGKLGFRLFLEDKKKNAKYIDFLCSKTDIIKYIENN